MAPALKTVALLVCLLLSACTKTEADENKKVLSGMGVGIDRYMDKELGVACYRYYGYSISCVKVTPQ